MDLCQNIAIITKQICNNRGDLSPLEGCNSKLAQLNVTALRVTVYLPTNQCSVFPNSVLIMESENFTQPSFPHPNYQHGCITILVSSVTSRNNLSPPFLVPKVTGAISYEDIAVPPPLLLPSLSQQCLSSYSDKDDSIKVLYCKSPPICLELDSKSCKQQTPM